MDELQVLGFTVEVALLAVALLAAPGLALAFVLARKDFRGKALVETLVALPLVMPPVATGSFSSSSSAAAGRSGAPRRRSSAPISRSRGGPSSPR